jgi:hypothetical protein
VIGKRHNRVMRAARDHLAKHGIDAEAFTTKKQGKGRKTKCYALPASHARMLLEAMNGIDLDEAMAQLIEQAQSPEASEAQPQDIGALMPILQDDDLDGINTINAADLYAYLGLDPSHYARWLKAAIASEFFDVGVDFCLIGAADGQELANDGGQPCRERQKPCGRRAAGLPCRPLSSMACADDCRWLRIPAVRRWGPA